MSGRLWSLPNVNHIEPDPRVYLIPPQHQYSEQDSNLQAFSTGPSCRYVYQFHHLSIITTSRSGVQVFCFFLTSSLCGLIYFQSNKGYYHAYRAIEQIRTAISPIPTACNHHYTTTAFVD